MRVCHGNEFALHTMMSKNEKCLKSSRSDHHISSLPWTDRGTCSHATSLCCAGFRSKSASPAAPDSFPARCLGTNYGTPCAARSHMPGVTRLVVNDQVTLAASLVHISCGELVDELKEPITLGGASPVSKRSLLGERSPVCPLQNLLLPQSHLQRHRVASTPRPKCGSELPLVVSFAAACPRERPLPSSLSPPHLTHAQQRNAQVASPWRSLARHPPDQAVGEIGRASCRERV